MITKLTPDNFEFFTLVTTPGRTFTSGSDIAGTFASVSASVTMSLTGTVGGPITESFAVGDVTARLNGFVGYNYQAITWSNTTALLVPTGSVFTADVNFVADTVGVMPVILGPTGAGTLTVPLNPNSDNMVRIYAHEILSYGSNFVEGTTGLVNVFPRRSTYEKEVQPLSLFSASLYQDSNLDDLRVLAVNSTASSIADSIQAYMSGVQNQQQSLRKQQRVEIIRFTPSFRFSSNTLRKNITRQLLMPYYRTVHPRAQWTIGNYHCLNFFTSSTVPTDSALLYPNSRSLDARFPATGSIYQISGAFSFDFYIRPKYTTISESNAYRPGTIMHLTGGYSLTLHSGSSKDINGRPNAYRLALAVTSAANTPPSELLEDQAFVYFSDDNALTKDDWQHVTIRWGGTDYNNGSGSFVIDGVNKGRFNITESFSAGFYNVGDPSVLVVGNYYEGENNGTTALDRFFAADTATRDGLLELNSTANVFAPSTSSFTHPLNAEIHELKLYERYLTVDEAHELSGSGPENLDGLRFYLPPFFTQESPYRQDLNNFGGVLYTPFFAVDGTTETPYAGEMAFGAGGHYINLENYTRELTTGLYPRLWQLSGSTFEPPSTTVLSANDFLYQTGSVRKRLYTVLPCDNGKFLPNFDLLTDLSSSKFVNDLGNTELGVVTLNNIVDPGGARASSTITTTGSILDDVLGVQPESGSVNVLPSDSLAVLHRTKDPSSNQVVFFDVSNLFYGNRIKPGSVVLSDTAISYSGHAFGITIKDDGLGNLYRANASGSHASWNSVGNVFYNEGIIVLKHPQLYFFGEDGFTVHLAGENNIHILTVNAFARSLREVTSSNPSYQPFVINDLANETDSKATWITGINLHDDNLNVIARTSLAQPVLKRSGDKFLFKIKLDF